jgi:hypothetical protein
MSNLRSVRGAVVAVALAAVPLCGCAGLGPQAREAVRFAIKANLEELNREENRRQIDALLASPEMRESTRRLTQDALDAGLDDLARPERAARLHQMAAGFVRDLGPALGEVLAADVLPRVRTELVAGVQDALARVLDDESRRKLHALVADSVRTAAESAAPAVSRALADGLSQAVDRSLQHALGGAGAPALGKALDANADALARALRKGTEGALLGAADAMRGEFGAALRDERRAFLKDLQAAAAAERAAWLADLHRQTEGWYHAFVVLALVAALLLLAAGFWLRSLHHENRRLRGGG